MKRTYNSLSVLRYGELASMAGKPGAARAVGSAMSNNPISLLVPCHRVLPACGGKFSSKAIMAFVLIGTTRIQASNFFPNFRAW